MTQAEEMVSLKGLKALADKHLKKDSQLRKLLLSEADYLPRSEAIAKIEVYSKILDDELKS